MKDHDTVDFGLAFMGIWFVVLSVVIFARARIHLRNGTSCVNWPKVVGTILESSQQLDDDGSPLISIQYRYQVNNQQYFGDRVSYDGHSMDFETVEQILIQYPVGTNFWVFYKKDEPTISTLQKGVSAKTIALMFCFFGMFQFAGWAMLFFAFY